MVALLCAMRVSLSAMFVGAGSLGARRTKHMKTALRIPAMRSVAVSKMRTATLTKSSRPGKKFEVRIGGTTIHFSATGYDDYTTHKDPMRKASYLSRHRNEHWDDPETAGFYGTNRQSVHP